MTELKFPTEVIDLPSRGLLYPKESPLSSGKVELKYMTAREEDILTNRNYIEKGIVIDKLLQSLIVGKVDYTQLVTGDQNAIMIAARILGYGKDYEFSYGGEKHVVDLTTLDDKPFDQSLITPYVNEFKYKLPHTQVDITFKILTIGDEEQIKQELNGLKKINKDLSPELSTRLKYTITSVNNRREQGTIRDFVDNQLLARDSKALREYIREVQPDIDLKIPVTINGAEEDITLPITVDFFWPDR